MIAIIFPNLVYSSVPMVCISRANIVLGGSWRRERPESPRLRRRMPLLAPARKSRLEGPGQRGWGCDIPQRFCRILISRLIFFFFTGLRILMMHCCSALQCTPSNTSLYFPRPTCELNHAAAHPFRVGTYISLSRYPHRRPTTSKPALGMSHCVAPVSLRVKCIISDIRATKSLCLSASLSLCLSPSACV
jgi:hypothetical protein